MRLTKQPVARHWAALLLFVLLAGCSGLAGEPEIAATFPPPPTAVPEVGFPQQPPDLAAGAQTFQARCTACHGTGGAGDGEMVRGGQVNAPPSFTDPATARSQTPLAWFETITNGRIEALMPPWKDALNEAQRWDVALYTYTLHYTPQQIAQGEAVWTSVCGENCDSLDGIGSLTDSQTMVTVSDDMLHAALPDTIAEADTWPVVAYLRSRMLHNINMIGQSSQIVAATEEAEDGPSAPVVATEEADSSQTVDVVPGTISGQISNGTAGGDVPEGLTVTLYDWDSQFNVSQAETTTGTDGTYIFEDVEIDATHAYAVAVRYRERRFASEIVRGDPANLPLQLPVTIYELTEDPAVLTITGLVNQITALGNGLQIVQVMNFQNTSDRVYTTSNAVNDNQFASVVLTLPPGANIIGFPNNEQRFIVSDDQTTVADTVPVLPGQDHIIQMVYLVPYEGDAIVEYPLNYALEGQVRLLLRPETLEIVGDTYQSIGPQEVGQNTYRGYGGTFSLSAADVISYEVRGQAAPAAAQLDPPAVTGGTLIAVVGIAMVALALVIAILFMVYQRRNRSADEGRLIDALVRQIAELDEAHDQGEINHDLYQRQRQQLKARLSELLSEDDEQ